MSIFRRQLMMQVGKSDPYVEFLKSLGCICYLPLGSEGDLQDRISKKSLTLTGNGSFTWVSSVEMYRVTTPSGNSQYVAWLDNGMEAASFPDNCFTTLTSFQKITSSGYYLAGHIAPISTNEITKIAINPMYNASSNVDKIPSGLQKLAYYSGEDERLLYQQGALYKTVSVYTQGLPSNWRLTKNGLAIGMIRMNDASNYFAKQFYLKDVYIFNKKLTLEQIRQIEGYD